MTTIQILTQNFRSSLIFHILSSYLHPLFLSFSPVCYHYRHRYPAQLQNLSPIFHFIHPGGFTVMQSLPEPLSRYLAIPR